MASEVELDLASIRDEDLLRHMWQQTEDFGRKKEIRACMYKLREARLREFYTKGDMDTTSGIGLTKSPLTPSHGESLVDQSFQSFKTKEIRDSESPTHELKFMTRPSGVIAPDTSGWNVVTSSEVSPDGKAYKTESLATTEGVTKLQGGHSRFAGKNEQVAQESFEGDDRNYVKKAGESSKTHLEESTVIGDEKSGRMESKSSTVQSSSSHKTTSKFSSSADDFQPFITDKNQILQEFDKLADSTSKTLIQKSHNEHQHQTSSERRSSTVKEERRHHQHHEEEQNRRHHQQQVQSEKYLTENITNQNRRQSDQRTTTDRFEQNREPTSKVTKVYLEEEVNKLAALPGTLISRKIDYPDENTQMITETKELADGTIVTTKRYERKSSKSKTCDSDSRTHHDDRSQNRHARDREISDKTTKRSQDIDTLNKHVDRRSSDFMNEANRRTSEIRREDIHKQNVEQKQTHEQVTRNESFKKHETQSFHKEQVKHHESDIRDHRARDEVDRAVTDNRHDRITRNEILKDQVENIALDSTHRTVKKDLSQTMRNEKLTNKDFIETERGCVMVGRSSRRPEQMAVPDQYYPNQSTREYTETETIKTTRKDSDFSTHGFPSVGPTRPQDKHPRKPSEDFTTHGFPSVGPRKPDDKHPHKPNDFTTHGFPSVKTPNDSKTEKIDQSYSSHHETVESRTNKTHQTTKQDFTTNGFPSTRPQKYVQEPDHRPRHSPETHGYPSGTDRTTTKEHYTTKHTDKQEYSTVHGYPSTKPQDRPDYERRSTPKTDTYQRPVTKEKVIDDRQDHVYNERRQSEFETYGFPVTQPKSKQKPDDFIGTHGYPSVPSHVDQDDRRFTSVIDDTSSVTTEQIEQTEQTTETHRTYGNDYNTSSRITVEVDAAHDAFARSLRCVSPVDQHRPASSKSMRTSSGSVRSSISPDKRSHRSPSRESGTYSESSKISTSTVTKTRTTDSDKKPIRKTTPTKPTDSGKISRKISDQQQRRSNETVDLTESKQIDRHNVTSHSFRKTSQQEKQTTSDNSDPRSPHSSPEHHVPIPLKQKTTTKPSEPIYDVPKSNKKISPSPDRSTKTYEKPKAVVNTTQHNQNTMKKPTKITEDDTTAHTTSITKTIKTTKETEVKKRISEDEGFDAESPRSNSPTCSVDDIEYYHNVKRDNQKVTDLDAADITVEVNLKNMGRNVNLVTTIGDKDYPYTVNHDFISNEKQQIEINQNEMRIEKDNVNFERPKHVKQPQQSIDKTDRAPQENGHYDRPQSNSVFYTRTDDEDKPKEREPFFLKKQHTHDDEPKKPEDIKKPKAKPVLTRSETYEERCRRILGMDQFSKSVEVEETTTSTDTDVNDFITTEINVEENNKRTKKPMPSSRDVSPTKSDKIEYDEETISNITIRTQKTVPEINVGTQITKSPSRNTDRSPSLSPIRRSKAPTRETSPNKISDHPTQYDDMNYLKTTISTRSQSSIVTTPSRSPYSSPSRKSTPRDTPNDTPQSRSPALSPARKPTRDTPNETPQSRSPALSPTRKPMRNAPNKTPQDRSPALSPTRESIRDTPNETPQSRSPVLSPTRKPTRDISSETSQDRSPALSPTRKPTATTPRSTEHSPTRQSQKPKSHKTLMEPNKISHTDREHIEKIHTAKERITTSSVIKKETVLKESLPNKEKISERPNHITTAKIQLSPSRKSSIIETEKPQRSTELKSKPRIMTTTTTVVRDEKTCKIPTQQTPTKSLISKSVLEKPARPNYRKEDQPIPSNHQPQVTTDKKPVSRFERSKTETDKTKIQKTTKILSTGPGPKKPSTVKKIPVIERKDSAPVHKTVRTDVDVTNQKMSRSVSENVIKTNSTRMKPEIEVSTTKSPTKDKPRKISSERRPSKCLSTKTINLTTTNTLINSEDMENVIIDIQQAKSSREPSPNKIVPTPVPLDEDTGMPRYPDKVQEPDEHPRKSNVKNIPIFEEESKNFIGCQITEIEDVEEETFDRRELSNIKIERDNTTTKTGLTETTVVMRDSKVSDIDEQISDECLMSVHDKVSKFISTAEEVKKPKTSAPFRRQEPVQDNNNETDVCYLSVTDKVTKFSNTAENVVKPITSISKKIERPNFDELDDDLKQDECVLTVSQKVNKFVTTVEKLAEPYQQKSAELVAKIDRQVSRSQPVNDKETSPEIIRNRSPVTTTNNDHYTPEKRSPVEKTPAPLPKPVALKSTEVVQKAKSVFERGNVFTSTPRQRDILSRPSVWEGRKMKSDVKLEDIGVYTKDEEDDSELVIEVCHSKSPELERSNEFINESKPKPTTQPFKILTNTVSSKKNIFENKISTSKNDIKSTKVTEIKTKLSDRRREFSPTSKTRPSEDQPVSKTYDRSPETRPSRDQPVSKIYDRGPETRPSRDQPVSKAYDRSPEIRPSRDQHVSKIYDRGPETRQSRDQPVSKIYDRSPEIRPSRDQPVSKTFDRNPKTRPSDDKHVSKIYDISPEDQPVSKTYDRSQKSKQFESETDTNTEYEYITETKKPEIVEEIPTSTVTEENRHLETYESHFETTSEDIEEEEIEMHTVSSKPDTRQPASPKSPGKTTPSSRFESPSKKAPKEMAYSPTTPKTRTPMDQSFTKQRSDTTRESKIDRLNKSQGSISAKRSLFEKSDNTTKSPKDSKPSYMAQTVSSLEHRRDSSEIVKTQSRRSSTTKETEIYETRSRESSARPVDKFGVELRRTNSRENAVRRKSSCSEIPHIEEIFDLELLEQMLNTVVGYEQRRRIRTQIRLVKKMMETQVKKENQISKTIVVKKTEHTTTSRGSSKSPDRYRSPTRREMVPMSPDSNEFTTIESQEIITEQEEHIHRERSTSPPVAKVKTVTTVKEIHKVGDKPATKKITTTTEVTDGKPIWATKNILKKASDNVRTTKPVSNVSRSTLTSKTRTTQRQPNKSSEDDCITSSYGIGPTDEDGRPLFGIRALKKKSIPGETTKVTGKVITEKYYSENGAEPIGERTVTVYSTNPDDIDVLEKTVEQREGETVEKSSRNGFATITKTKKVGAHQQDLERTEIPAITHTTEVITTKTTPKIVRKGSVKEISEKFIRKESSSSVTEKQTSTSSSSYPKAGLILRAQTHSNKNYDDDDYEIDYDDPTEECDIEIKTTRKHSRTVLTESDSETESVKLRRTKINQSTRSFLNSTGSKVTGVEDVLDRMRNADNLIEDGDTPEDQEARALLNKFLGASVLMSGVESMVPKDVKMTVTTTGVGPNLRKQEVKTTRITKTIKKEDSSSPVLRKTCDIEEIWDEELLNKLLEQSTSVEERRRIRARLRQLMAEREESCTTETTETKKEEDGAVVKTTTKVTTRTVSAAAAATGATASKPISPFAKFRQLDKQNSVQSPRTFK